MGLNLVLFVGSFVLGIIFRLFGVSLYIIPIGFFTAHIINAVVLFHTNPYYWSFYAVPGFPFFLMDLLDTL